MHSVICTRARAPSGDDDRDSFSIYVSRLRSAPDRSARRLSPSENSKKTVPENDSDFF